MSMYHDDEGGGTSSSNVDINDNNNKILDPPPIPSASSSASMPRFLSLSNMYIQSSDSLRGVTSNISSLLSSTSWSSIPSNNKSNDYYGDDHDDRDDDDDENSVVEATLPEGWNDAPPLFLEHEENITWIKTMIRQGIPHPLRCAVWLSNVILVVHNDLELAKEFRTLSKVRILDHTYATVLDEQVGWKHLIQPQEPAVVSPPTSMMMTMMTPMVDPAAQAAELAASAPTFGNHDWEHHLLLAVDAVTGGRLPVAGQLTRIKVLLALESTLGIEYAPMLPTLVSILLMVMSESYTFYAIREMLHAPGLLTPYYIATNPLEYLAQARAFADVLTKLHPQTAQTMQDIGILPRSLTENEPSNQAYDDVDDDTQSLASGLVPIFQDFFVSLLPFPQVLRIMDIFTLEGIKVMFRIGVALVCLFQRDCPKVARHIQTPFEFWEAIHDYTHDPSSPYQFEVLFKKAYGVHGHVMQGSTAASVLRRGSRRRILHSQPIKFPTRYILARIMKMEEEQVLLALAERRIKYPTTKQKSKSTTWSTGTVRPLGLIDHVADEALKTSSPSSQRHGTSTSALPVQTVTSNFEMLTPTSSIYLNRPFTTETELPRPILAQSVAVRTALAQWLPLSLRFTNMDLIFSTNFHGRSLERFYSHVQNYGKTLLLAQVLHQQHLGEDERKADRQEEVIIGMYASQPWKPTNHVYGDGECFLFRLTPDPQAWKWKPRIPPSQQSSSRDDDHDDVSFFFQNAPTTPQPQPPSPVTTSGFDNTAALREQFMVATSQYISMGANPDGSCGLRFNEDFTKGASSTALGFDNEPLVPYDHMFEVGLVEVYRLIRQFDGHTN